MIRVMAMPSWMLSNRSRPKLRVTTPTMQATVATRLIISEKGLSTKTRHEKHHRPQRKAKLAAWKVARTSQRAAASASVGPMLMLLNRVMSR